MAKVQRTAECGFCGKKFTKSTLAKRYCCATCRKNAQKQRIDEERKRFMTIRHFMLSFASAVIDRKATKFDNIPPVFIKSVFDSSSFFASMYEYFTQYEKGE